MLEYPKYKKVLFCTDFSENSDYAFNFAYGIAKRDEGVLYILHVIPPNPYQKFAENVLTPEDLVKMQKNMEEYLDDNYKKRYVNEIGNEITYKIVTKSGMEDIEIINLAKQENVDIIVMGTHGNTGIKHVFFGSVAEKVIRHSPIPVFIIPDKGKLERHYGR